MPGDEHPRPEKPFSTPTAPKACWLIANLVPRGGLEPPRPCGLRILSPLRLMLNHSYIISYTHLIVNCVSLCVNYATFSRFHISSFGVMFPTSRAERGVKLHPS